MIIYAPQGLNDEIVDFAHTALKERKNIKTVVIKHNKVSGKYRVANIEYLLGEKKLETVHNEYGSKYLLDPTKVFFSPRLSFERQRIASLVKEGEKIINFFAGVGPFSIAIASRRENVIVHSIEINPIAFHYLKLNIELNHCQGKVIPHLGDALEIVPHQFSNYADRVILPLPLLAEKSLPIAIKTLKNLEGVIHWQITEKITQNVDINRIVSNRIEKILMMSSLDTKIAFEITKLRKIRNIAPRISHFAVDLKINS